MGGFRSRGVRGFPVIHGFSYSRPSCGGSASVQRGPPVHGFVNLFPGMVRMVVPMMRTYRFRTDWLGPFPGCFFEALGTMVPITYMYILLPSDISSRQACALF